MYTCTVYRQCVGGVEKALLECMVCCTCLTMKRSYFYFWKWEWGGMERISDKVHRREREIKQLFREREKRGNIRKGKGLCRNISGSCIKLNGNDITCFFPTPLSVPEEPLHLVLCQLSLFDSLLLCPFCFVRRRQVVRLERERTPSSTISGLLC